VHAVLNDVVMS